MNKEIAKKVIELQRRIDLAKSNLFKFNKEHFSETDEMENCFFKMAYDNGDSNIRFLTETLLHNEEDKEMRVIVRNLIFSYYQSKLRKLEKQLENL